MLHPLPPYLSNSRRIHEKRVYEQSIKRMKKGLNPGKNMFDDLLLHNSIREILGEELSLQLIKEAHDKIGAKRANRERAT